MMYATKETSVIAFGAAAAAFVLARGWKGPTGKARSEAVISSAGSPDGSVTGMEEDPGTGGSWLHLALAAVIALAVAFLFFSSFLGNPQGFLDSILSFRIYFTRAGEAGFHVQPWHYYLGKFAYTPGHGGPFWSEGLLLTLAVAGAVAAFVSRADGRKDAPFPRFLVFYSALAAAVYSAIPYKTPWNLLPFAIGFILLAGTGAAWLVSLPRRTAAKLGVAIVLAAGFLHLGFQNRRASFVYPADTRNPYVYAQTSPDYLKLVRRVEDIAALAPEGRNMLVKVIAGPHETWPLPWSLRRFGRVGYWPDAAAAGDVGRPPVVISSAEETAKLDTVLEADYQSAFYGLRPGTLLTLSIRNDLWESFLKDRGR
jgi:predicted membrane-bound mannosyltransferase